MGPRVLGFPRIDVVWIPGFWVDDRLDELVFVSKPPAPKVTTPLDPAPSDKHFWVEGFWLYQRGEYQWQPGVWAESQPGWVWEPARYVQTPSGWVFVDGYWDYEPAQRGLMFAPLDFSEEVLRVTAGATRPAVLERTFSPQVAVQSMESLQHWFVQPTYSHYYYGNYYDPRMHSKGSFLGLLIKPNRRTTTLYFGTIERRSQPC